MTCARLQITRAGPHCTIQDGGRAGFLRWGIPASGPMDRKALAIANAALGNPPGAAGIEVGPGGLDLELAGAPLTLAVAGGGFLVQVDGSPRPAWAVLRLDPGQRLTIRPGPWGSWACVAVGGRILAPGWLGSLATHGPSGLGGGRLAAGSVVEVAGHDPAPGPDRAIPCPVWARPRRRLMAVAGPQDRFFAPEALAALAGQPFRLTAAWDRMGLRLSGPPLPPQGALGVPSEPVLRGSVQVSGDGVATVLLADHQTTGGYPKIATLLADDVDGLVQNRPGDAVTFALVPPQAAVQTARLRAAVLAAFLPRLSPATRR
ncbi:MAG: biotin-dependent carboxyltransferase family protein [Rhodobacterales bacterium]|nr:biotin-dependent carboxyltransferase family protein [Rhodobacterales bacterium]